MRNTWYKHELRVHYQDTDQMGVAHHANYVGWFEIARTEMMRNAGITYKEIEKLGLLLPVLDMNITYRRPAHYDDQLIVYSKITTYSPIRLEFSYEISRSSNALKVIASGTTTHMWLNDKWKPARIDKIAPDVFELVKQHSSEQ